MDRRLAGLLGLALVMGLAIPGASSARAGSGVSPRLIATLPSGPYGTFGESVAVNGGNLYVSLTTWSPDDYTPNEGQVWRIGPTGKLTRFGPSLDVCLLSGLAFDDLGRLFVGTYSCDLDFVQPSGVIRIDPDGTTTRVLTLPPGAFPNGLAFHDGDLYVSDFLGGAIWRVRPQADANVTPDAPWIESPLLAPTRNAGGGANGIAFWGDTLYVVTYPGAVVRIPVRPDGSPETPAVVTRSRSLAGSDGIAFDAEGALWIAVNTGSLARMDPDGRISVVVDDPAWLDYPAQPAFGRSGRDATTMYLVNGSFYNGTPNVVAFDAGVAGQRLP